MDIIDAIQDINASGRIEYECIGFFDDNRSRHGQNIMAIEVIGALEDAANYPDAYVVNSIGSPTNFWLKEQIISKTGLCAERFLSLIHPSASISKTASIGFGSVILRNVSINAYAEIGNHVIIYPNTVISHHDVIGDYTNIMGGSVISGNVTIGNSCYISPNCAINENLSIGNGSLVNIGSTVFDDIPENNVVGGNPAKFLRNTREKTK